jgi:hypothetical protein
VDNVVLVAIVDTRKNLLHENSGILLCELSSRDDLIEKLSTFADPISRFRPSELAYSVTM